MAIILLVGPSGSGKTTIGKELESKGIKQLVSYTTRPMREGEVDGRDYYFLENRDYGMESIPLVEYSHYSGNDYGLSRKEVEEKLRVSDDVYFICDRNGAKQIIEEYPDETVCFWINIGLDEMLFRLKGRGDSDSDIVKRMMNAVTSGELEKPVFTIEGVGFMFAEVIDGRKRTVDIAHMIEIQTERIITKRRKQMWLIDRKESS